MHTILYLPYTRSPFTIDILPLLLGTISIPPNPDWPVRSQKNFSVVPSIERAKTLERGLLQLNVVTRLPSGVTVLTGSPPAGGGAALIGRMDHMVS